MRPFFETFHLLSPYKGEIMDMVLFENGGRLAPEARSGDDISERKQGGDAYEFDGIDYTFQLCCHSVYRRIYFGQRK